MRNQEWIVLFEAMKHKIHLVENNLIEEDEPGDAHSLEKLSFLSKNS